MRVPLAGVLPKEGEVSGGIQKSEALSALAALQQKHSLAGKCQPAREAGAAA